MFNVPTGAATAPTLDVTTRLVIAWCNQARAELGLPPRTDLRAGARLNPWFCPVCRTIGEGMAPHLQPEFAGQTFRVWLGPKLLRLEWEAPTYVAQWSERFDRGGYRRYAITRDRAFALGWS